MRVDLDKLPKKDIDTVLGLLSKYKYDIQSRKYANMYTDLYDQIDPVFIGEVTSVLYASDIDPLKYMGVVPYHFLYGGKCVSGDLIIPDNIISIGNSAFYGCTGLTSVTIQDSVMSIGNSAFQGCTNLTRVTIGSDVTIIDEWAFYKCRNLTNITYLGTKQKWKSISKESSWDLGTGINIIHCTDGDTETE